MTKLLCDTHTLIWLVEKDKRLGKKALSAITDAHTEESLCVSAISFWEIGMMVAKQRMAFNRPLEAWRSDILAAGISELPLNGDVMMRATRLDWKHSDAVDRLLAASAFTYGCALITANSVILDWKHGPLAINASE